MEKDQYTKLARKINELEKGIASLKKEINELEQKSKPLEKAKLVVNPNEIPESKSSFIWSNGEGYINVQEFINRPTEKL